MVERDADSDLGVVVIGRNEQATLEAALESALVSTRAVVYADSDSADDSRQIAGRLGVSVVALQGSPRSAARGRNAGLAKLVEVFPHLEFVQFLDGDCVLEAGWLERARAFLQREPTVAVLAGLLRERDRERNVYHRLADMEWNTPPGEVDATGGIMMVRRQAWQQVRGMNPAITAGEELDFCLRIGAAGWRVVKLSDPMANHDIGMSQFSQWWRRSERAGQSNAEATWRRGVRGRGSQAKNLGSALAWGGALPLAAAVTVPATLGVSLAGAAGLYALLWKRVRDGRIARGDSPEDAALYASFCVASKFSECAGALRFGWRLATRGGVGLRRLERGEPCRT